MSERGDLCRDAANVISERGLALGVLEDSTGAVCLNGALMVSLGLDPKTLSAERSFTELMRAVGDLLVERGIAPIGRYWNPLMAPDSEENINLAGADGCIGAAGWSNACAFRGRPDEVIHGLKLVAESFDLEDEA